MKLLGILLLASLLSAAAVSQVQTPGTAPSESVPDISVDVARVDVRFTVADGRGNLVTTLEQEDFRVFEDDQIQQILSFVAETDLPLTIALLMDVSQSVLGEKLRFQQEAAIEFFHSTLRRGQDKALLISFDSGVDLHTENAGGAGRHFTDDAGVLADSIRRLRAGGGTAMYDAIYAAATMFLREEDGRKVIIVISDGDDTASRKSMTEAIEAAQKSDAAIYVISPNMTAYFGTAAQDRGNRILRGLAEDTGGRSFFPFQLADIAANFMDIGQELRSQYALTYAPTNTRLDGTFRRIRIDVAQRGLDARARAGYYAPVAAAAQ